MNELEAMVGSLPNRQKALIKQLRDDIEMYFTCLRNAIDHSSKGDAAVSQSTSTLLDTVLVEELHTLSSIVDYPGGDIASSAALAAQYGKSAFRKIMTVYLLLPYEVKNSMDIEKLADLECLSKNPFYK
jgi:hypothetical protein